MGEKLSGDFAVYPTEQLVHFARTNGKGGLQTLTLESGADLTVGVHSPVNILVTDPLGRQTGYLADGTFVQQIPGSSYDVEVDDSDEDPYVPPTDPVSDVTIPNPMPGSYEIQLTGTATGPTRSIRLRCRRILYWHRQVTLARRRQERRSSTT